MGESARRVGIDRSRPGHWRVRLDHPPINTLDDQMYDELFDLVVAMDEDPALKVVTFESAHPDFFLAHYGMGESRSRFGSPRWVETADRLGRSRVISIAVIRGRARGGGSEFALACDLRFASREKAVFGQPEVGFGLIPGGGALERLPLLVGRSRALEIVLGGEDFDADTALRLGWINRSVSDGELSAQVERFVQRILSFDRHTLATLKGIVNHSGLPEPQACRDTQTAFLEMWARPECEARLARAYARGAGASGPFETDLGQQILTLAPDEAV